MSLMHVLSSSSSTGYVHVRVHHTLNFMHCYALSDPYCIEALTHSDDECMRKGMEEASYYSKIHRGQLQAPYPTSPSTVAT